MLYINHLNRRAKKKVMTGRQFAVAAASVADVYVRAIPYTSRLPVILVSEV